MTNDLPSVGTEDARTVSLPEYIFGGEAGEFEKVWDERTVRALVSERDELASRVRELEGALQGFYRNSNRHDWPADIYDAATAALPDPLEKLTSIQEKLGLYDDMSASKEQP